MGSIVLDSVEEDFSLHLNGVLLVPRLGFKIMSSAQLMKNGITLLGEPGKFTLKYGDKKLGTAVEQNGVFVLNFIPERTTADSENILSLGPWEHRDNIDYTDDTVPRDGVVPTSSTTAAAVMLTFDNQGLNDVQNSRDYLAHVAGWGDTTNMPTDDGIWGADEPDETTWGETPAERDDRLRAEAEQRVADMEILDSCRLVGVEPVPAASDQESGELVLAPGKYVDVEVKLTPTVHVLAWSNILARYVAPGRHRPEHMAAAKRVLRYLCSTSGLGLVLGGRRPVVLTGHADASWADDQATQRSSQGYTFSLGSGSVSWRSTRSSSVLGSSCEAEIYAGAMTAQELRWLTYLLTDLGEPPRSPPVLYVDNKAMLALCREHRLEHRTKHIALRYFLARELQQRGQLRLAYVASEANTADIFTKALPSGNHQRFCTMLACFALLDWSCDLLFSPTLPMGVFLLVPNSFC
ncbi:unnamed protein product [Closterium sp. NIES-53]